ncbi:MAG: HIT family protein [Candidatus Doudnabacteria bacterium]|nr:HIT family protein [Candidatus Doudnabacteria bacterium]
MTDCIFCKIASGEIQTSKVFEDDKVVAFLDLHPKTAGHTLVVHKTHTKDLQNTPDEVLAELMSRIKLIAEKQMKVNNASGFNLSVNNGQSAGQEIFHLHFHIIPRK